MHICLTFPCFIHFYHNKIIIPSSKIEEEIKSKATQNTQTTELKKIQNKKKIYYIIATIYEFIVQEFKYLIDNSPKFHAI